MEVSAGPWALTFATSTTIGTPGVFACGLLQQAMCLVYICNGRAIQRKVKDGPPLCTIMGDIKRNWADARTYCRSYGGALYTSSLESAATYYKNGVTSLWSGYYKQNNRVLQETSTTPVRATFHPDLWKVTGLTTLASGDQCGLYTYVSCRMNRSRMIGRRRNSPANTGTTECKDKFQLIWKTCDGRKTNFVCQIPAGPLISMEVQNSKSYVSFSVNEDLGFKMYFTSGKTEQATADSACKSIDSRGSVYSISNSADREVLKFVAREAHHQSIGLGLSQQELRTTLFWFYDPYLTGCEALSIDPSGSQDSMANPILSWPCRATLRVLCKREDLIYETKPPVFFVNGPEDYVQRQNSVVFTHSETLRREFLGRSSASKGPAVRIGCRASLFSQRQNLTYYVDDKPLAYTKGTKDSDSSERDFLVGESFFPSIPDPIDLVGYHHCEVNDLKTHRVVKSNRLFILPRDLEIYVVAFRLKRLRDQQDWQELSQLLEFDGPSPSTWAAAGKSLLEKLDILSGIYSVKLLALKSRSLSLVTYIYRQLSGIPIQGVDELTSLTLKNSLSRIQDIGTLAVGRRVGSLEIESVRVKLLGDCLATDTALLPVADACFGTEI